MCASCLINIPQEEENKHGNIFCGSNLNFHLETSQKNKYQVHCNMKTWGFKLSNINLRKKAYVFQSTREWERESLCSSLIRFMYIHVNVIIVMKCNIIFPFTLHSPEAWQTLTTLLMSLTLKWKRWSVQGWRRKGRGKTWMKWLLWLPKKWGGSCMLIYLWLRGKQSLMLW